LGYFNSGVSSKVVAQPEGNGLVFKADAINFHQYIAFTANNYLSVEFVNEVPNQNLHSYRNIDYLIVVHPDFYVEAEHLADFHRANGTLDVLVVTVDQVYNEFSSGGQDITAIRDFAKMLYDDSDSGKEIKYLLLLEMHHMIIKIYYPTILILYHVGNQLNLSILLHQ